MDISPLHIPDFPGTDASLDSLIRYYFNQMYNQREIRAFLILRHGRQISKTNLRRTLRALGLRRNGIEAPNGVIIEGIFRLFEAGFTDAGYRVIWRLLNTILNIRATQITVARNLRLLDPEAIMLRRGRRLRRRQYQNGGPFAIVHLDGYDKLKPFGFPIHGAIDGFSRQILWLKVLRSNNNPYFVSYLYLDMLIEHGRIPQVVRVDGGNENIVVKELQTGLRCNHDDVMSGSTCFIVGRSTGNQRIEAFWSFLKRIFTVKWRNMFQDLEQIGLLQTGRVDDIENARMWFTSVIQNELDYVKYFWNTHRIRAQMNVELTTGEVPEVLFHQPELFSATDCSLPLPCSVDELSELTADFRNTESIHGCSESFLARVLELAEIPRESIELPVTVNDALQLYIATKELLEPQRNGPTA